MTPLSPRASRALAVALLVAVVALIGLAGVGPLIAYSNRLNVDLNETRGTIARFAAIAAARETYEQQIKAIDTEQIESTVYLPGDSPGVAAASLQELARQVAKDEGADLKSTQALPGETEDEHQRARVRVVVQCNIATLAGVLVALEAHIPLIFVSNLDIEPMQGGSGETGGEPDLLVRFDLYGYRKDLAE